MEAGTDAFKINAAFLPPSQLPLAHHPPQLLPVRFNILGRILSSFHLHGTAGRRHCKEKIQVFFHICVGKQMLLPDLCKMPLRAAAARTGKGTIQYCMVEVALFLGRGEGRKCEAAAAHSRALLPIALFGRDIGQRTAEMECRSQHVCPPPRFFPATMSPPHAASLSFFSLFDWGGARGRRRDSLLPAPLATPTHCGMTLQGWGNRVVRQSWKGRGKRQFLRVKDLLCIL